MRRLRLTLFLTFLEFSTITMITSIFRIILWLEAWRDGVCRLRLILFLKFLELSAITTVMGWGKVNNIVKIYLFNFSNMTYQIRFFCVCVR